MPIGPRTLLPLLVLLMAPALVACGNPLHRETDADKTTPPTVGACRDLDARDLSRPSNADPVVPCSRPHTAQTFAVGTLPASTGKAYDDRRHGAFVYQSCQQQFADFIGADESLAVRSRLSWAWFRASELGWERGGRWFRCDLIGGPEGTKTLRPLPADGRGMLDGNPPPDEWMTCARGSTVPGSTKVPCSEPHDWRAVTTIKLGQPGDPYPGDRVVEVRTRDYCSDWIGAWTNYTSDYDFGYTWFHEAEWAAGNRRSICWARTAK